MTITDEEFQAWREDPVTAWVLAALKAAAEEQKAAWLDATWEQGECDTDKLIELRTRADAYRALVEIKHADIVEWNA